MGPKVSTTTLSHHTSSPPGPHPLGDYCRGLFSSIRGCCPIPNPYPAQNQAPKAGFRFFFGSQPHPHLHYRTAAPTTTTTSFPPPHLPPPSPPAAVSDGVPVTEPRRLGFEF